MESSALIFNRGERYVCCYYFVISLLVNIDMMEERQRRRRAICPRCFLPLAFSSSVSASVAASSSTSSAGCSLCACLPREKFVAVSDGSVKKIVVIQDHREAKRKSLNSISVVRAAIDPDVVSILTTRKQADKSLALSAEHDAELEYALGASEKPAGFILFPGASSISVAAAREAHPFVQTLFVIDGTWKQAKRIVGMPRIAAALKSGNLIKVHVNAEKAVQSMFVDTGDAAQGEKTVLRKEPKGRDGFVSTLQALCLALRDMDQSEITSNVCNSMLDAFRHVLQRQLKFVNDATKDLPPRRKPKRKAVPAAPSMKSKREFVPSCNAKKPQCWHWVVCCTEMSLGGTAKLVPHGNGKVVHASYAEARRTIDELNCALPRGKRLCVMPASKILALGWTCETCGKSATQ